MSEILSNGVASQTTRGTGWLSTWRHRASRFFQNQFSIEERDTVEKRLPSYRLGLERWAGQAYDEATFRHFLALERKRVERSNRSLFLVLVIMNARSALQRSVTPIVAARLFSSLWLSVREMDFTGWYREGRTAGAVLMQDRGAPGPDAALRIRARVIDVLEDRLTSRLAGRLHVRVIELHPRHRT